MVLWRDLDATSFESREQSRGRDVLDSAIESERLRGRDARAQRLGCTLSEALA